MEWYRRDKEAVAEALRQGERPDLATTMASGPLDELVALHEELGIFKILYELEYSIGRQRITIAFLLFDPPHVFPPVSAYSASLAWKHLAGIEGTLSQAVRRMGLRRAR